jgi:hypothetical protein
VKIFVGYGYNDRDEWIEDLVFPFIKALGDEVVTGKEIFGQNLDEGVKSEIAECDALIGFTTRRDKIGDGERYTTSVWVRDELVTAANLNPPIPFMEVRESKVDPQAGMLGGRARINYGEESRDRCLVELAQAINRWHHLAAAFELELMPEDFSKQIRPLLRDPSLRCLYRVLERNKAMEGPEACTPILPFPGRLAIRTGAVPRDAMIRVEVWCQNRLIWRSDLQWLETHVIHLAPEEKK